MDQRERFEAWYAAWSMPAESDWFRKEEDGEYFWPTTHNAWYAWQAAEAAALESAAQMCERFEQDVLKPNRQYSGQDVDCYAETATRCAVLIRKLAAPVERGGE
jgi:hypothetical protein